MFLPHRLYGLVFLLLLIALPGLAQDYDFDQRFEENAARARAVLVKDPEDARANLSLGAALTGHFEFAAAVPYLQRVLQHTRDARLTAEVCYSLAVAHFAIGQTEPARRYYRQARNGRLGDGHARLLQNWGLAMGIDPYFDAWYTVDRPHVIYHFQDTADARGLDAYMARHDSAYAVIARFFRPAMPKKVDFFLWHSDDTAQVLFGRPLGFTRPVVSVCHNRKGQSPGHELVHAVVFWASQTRNWAKFINEGLAVCFGEGGGNPTERARQAWQGQPTPDVKDLWLFERKIPDEQLYPLAGAFVAYLFHHDPEKIRLLAADQLYLSASTLYGAATLDSLIRDFTRQFEAR